VKWWFSCTNFNYQDCEARLQANKCVFDKEYHASVLKNSLTDPHGVSKGSNYIKESRYICVVMFSGTSFNYQGCEPLLQAN
jgi:hypothetical protein